jgi:tRNA threonylcarbamoyladenosine biosynthesis protein TsaB
MRILAVDTSAVCASVAVVENGRIRAQSSTNAGLTHSRTLLPMIDALLQNSETPLTSIDCFACAVGPGSFTGIRIGIAAIKGLCDGTGKQALAVSTLEGLAYNLLGQDVLACAVMDARCNQVYTALFDVHGDAVTRLTADDARKIEDLGKLLEQYKDRRIVFVGDGADKCAQSLPYPAAPALTRFQNAASVALAAERSFDESRLLDAQQLLPVYLRLPQAERELRALRARS